MRMYDIIKHKRDGGTLSPKEIKFFVDGFVKGEIPSYQVSALLMAIFYMGMTDRETADLTFAIRDSGDKLDIKVDGIKADKHSTGGVGDKTSLIVMPIVASCGIKVAKMSGRGLGHTGGTVDKLESIMGFNTDLDNKSFAQIVDKVGICIAGQSGSLAPADKLLYALRDVTATVDSIPLIASSIMGKKLAANDEVIVLDVKSGSGAFMKTEKDSFSLARACVDIGAAAGKKVSALITDMDRPLGYAIGNSLEVIEAIEALNGKAANDLYELCIALAAEILYLCDMGSLEHCQNMAKEQISSGKALKTFANFVSAQGGDAAWVYDTTLFPMANHTFAVKAEQSGYITSVDTEGYGLSCLLLGAGRNKVGEKIDYQAGIILHKKTGDYVNAGEPIATLHYNSADVNAVAKKLLESTFIGSVPPKSRPLILGRVKK